jgi:hypothetical protein
MTISVASPSPAKAWFAAPWKAMKATARINRVAEVEGR